MKKLFEFIKAAIEDRILTGTAPDEKPYFKEIVMWNQQSVRERVEKNQNPFRTPTVFVEFIVNDIVNFSLGIKNVNLTIRFRFALQNMKFTRLDDLDIQETFDKFIQGLRGNPSDDVQFGTLQEISTELDEAFDNLNEPFVDYSTVWRKNSAYKQDTDILVTPVAADITGTVVIDPEDL